MTTPFTVRNKEIASGKAELSAAFKLPDGDYTVRISPARSALPAIMDIVAWYNSLGEIEVLDPGLLPVLMPKSIALSCLLTDYAVEVNELGQAEEAAALRWEAETDALLAEMEAATNGGAFNMTRAMAVIKPKVAHLKKEKVETKQAKTAAKTLHTSFINILARMNQQVGILRGSGEYERRMGGR